MDIPSFALRSALDLKDTNQGNTVPLDDCLLNDLEREAIVLDKAVQENVTKLSSVMANVSLSFLSMNDEI